MPKLKKKWNEIEESTGGFSDIEPGAYVLTVTGMDPHEPQEYVRLYWDVADGPHKGAYSQSQYPPSDVLSWKESAYGMLKHKLHALAEANTGFQPTVAFESDDWNQFRGKRFYAVVRRRLYTAGPNSNNPGADRISMEIAQWLNPEDFKAKNFNQSLLKDNDQRDTDAIARNQQSSKPNLGNVVEVPDTYGQEIEIADDDIPF